MYRQFNIQQFYVLPTQNKHQADGTRGNNFSFCCDESLIDVHYSYHIPTHSTIQLVPKYNVELLNVNLVVHILTILFLFAQIFIDHLTLKIKSLNYINFTLIFLS